MPEPAPARPDELGELRQLLIGPEIVSQVLPEAIRSARGKALREALEPVFERAFAESVKKHPKMLAEAISPIMAPAIVKAIAAAIRDFTEALNQIVEKSFSVKAIRWRIESIVSGKPFTEILLSRSLLYSVDQVFLIHRSSGLLLQHVEAQGSVLKDADMISGMLTAIQDFVSDSFEVSQDLETVDAGRFKLWLTYSPKVLLVGVVSGTAPLEIRQVFRKALDGIGEALQGAIDNFRQDDLSVFDEARPFLEACLLGQSPAGAAPKARLWPYLAALAAIVLGIGAWWIRSEIVWRNYLESVKSRESVVVTSVEKGGPGWVITGMKDALAPDPDNFHGKVKFLWQPYLSLNTSFAARREREDAFNRVSRQIIRFDSDSAKLTIAEADRIEDLTREIRELLRLDPRARIAVEGHADETGDTPRNVKLSLDRAMAVADALVAEGVPQDALDPAGLGSSHAVRTGSTDWDRATNRAVSFRVQLH